jgi:hypothetical protein
MRSFVRIPKQYREGIGLCQEGVEKIEDRHLSMLLPLKGKVKPPRTQRSLKKNENGLGPFCKCGG